MRRNRTLKAFALLASVATAFTLAACSSEADGATSGEPIVIGTITDRSGPTASSQEPWFRGFDSAIKEANATGGVNGRQIELHAEDDKFDTAAGLASWKKLVNQEGAVLVTGFGNGSLQGAVAPLLESSKVPALTGVSTAKESLVPFSKYFFATPPNYADQVDVMTSFANELVGKAPKLAVIHSESATGTEVASLVKETSGKGYEFVGNFALPAASTSADAIFQQVQDSGADAVVMHGNAGLVNLVLKSEEKFGAAIPIIGIAAVGSPAAVAGVSDKTAALFSSVQPVSLGDTSVPGYAKMKAAAEASGYEKELGSPLYVVGYVTGLMVIEALEGAGDEVTGETVERALSSITNLDTQGLSGTYGFGDNKRAGLTESRPNTWDPARRDFVPVGEFKDYAAFVTGRYSK